MTNYSVLLERFTRIIGERIAAGDNCSETIDNALMTWKLQKREAVRDKEISGKPFLIAGLQVGPKGGYFSIDSLTEFLQTREPAVAHCQELRTARHKIVQLKKNLLKSNEGYAMFTCVSEGYNTVAGQHLASGVATLIQVDLTES
eukprot:2999530-Rhodomonas_salina.3